jgi:ribonuclease D
MLEYAAGDTHHLPVLRDVLKEQLIAKGRFAWAEEEFSLLSGVRWQTIKMDEPAYLRLKGAKALNGRELAVLRELFQWRDDLAQRTDRAAFRILNNEPMLFMAKSPPMDFRALKEVRGIGPEQAERRGKEILAAVHRGLAIPDNDLPRITRPQRRAPDPAYEARLERLKAIRNQLAARYDLAPGVICSNGTLEAVARTNPRTIEEMAEISELRRWQLKEIGGDLLQALQRPAA